MSRQVTVTLTEAEASALWSLASCSADTWDDARNVLVSGAKVAAGYRALDKLSAARLNAARGNRRVTS